MGSIRFIEKDSYSGVSELSALMLMDCVIRKPDALICVATGASPLGMYAGFVRMAHERALDTSRLRIIKLDEWLDIPPDSPATCEYYIRENLLNPLQIPSHHYVGFAADANRPSDECDRIDKWLDENGPIDFCVLGIGKNGHLGLNEPASSLKAYSHTAELEAKTKTHEMLGRSDYNVTRGITLGMAQILASKQILLIAAGDEKAEVFSTFKAGGIRTDIPATLLWLHQNTVCVCNI